MRIFTRRNGTLLAMLGLLGATAAVGYPSIRTKMVGSWSSDQRLLVKSAADRAIRRMFKQEILKCADDNAKKDHPSSTVRQRFKKLQANVELAHVEISKLGMSCPTYGTATTGRAYINVVREGLDDLGQAYMEFEIMLNENCIGEDSSRYKSTDANFWAGVIAHEMGHNLGLTHPTGYPGSWIREWEKCIEYNGDWNGSEDLESGLGDDHIR